MSVPEVDAHFHVWELERFRYPWPNEDVLPIFKTISFGPLEAALETAKVGNAVFVQCLNNTPEEALWVLNDDHPGAIKLVKGVVAGVNLTNHAETTRQLEELCQFEKFVGVRHILDMEEDPAWVMRDDVIAGLKLVAEKGKTFDFLARPHHLQYVSTLAKAIPELRIVIDHIAKPLLSTSLEVAEDWRRNMAAAAACPNVYCKISGLVTEVDPVSHALPWTRDTFRDHVDVVLKEFGAERCMVGSDWPVLQLTGKRYNDVNLLHKSLVEGLSESEQKAVLGGTATKFYKLNVN